MIVWLLTFLAFLGWTPPPCPARIPRDFLASESDTAMPPPLPAAVVEFPCPRLLLLSRSREVLNVPSRDPMPLLPADTLEFGLFSKIRGWPKGRFGDETPRAQVLPLAWALRDSGYQFFVSSEGCLQPSSLPSSRSGKPVTRRAAAKRRRRGAP